MREIKDGLEQRCPYCRELMPDTWEEEHYMKRVKANDPAAISYVAKERHIQGNYEAAFEYFTKAAELGDADGHYELSVAYREGNCVEKDEKREAYHAEEAAIGGHPSARIYLGNHEGRNGRFDRATKHYIIAAKLGYDEALEGLKVNFGRGLVSKEDYETALRGHQAAVDATKSEQRDMAELYDSQDPGNQN